MNTENVKKSFELSPEDLGRLGAGAFGYIREIGSTEALKLLGPYASVPKDAKLFCLYSADGTPMSISGNREGAIASAMEHEMQTMSVH
jgi:hypothetical protein